MVLKIEDLRIGSLFHIEVRDHYRLVSIGMIYRNKVAADMLPNYLPMKVDLYKLKPIVLNEKEMLSMGFKAVGEWWKHPLLTGGIRVDKYGYEYQRGLRFNYVHEVQTFMFALTGKDIVYEYRSK